MVQHLGVSSARGFADGVVRGLGVMRAGGLFKPPLSRVGIQRSCRCHSSQTRPGVVCNVVAVSWLRRCQQTGQNHSLPSAVITAAVVGSDTSRRTFKAALERVRFSFKVRVFIYGIIAPQPSDGVRTQRESSFAQLSDLGFVTGTPLGINPSGPAGFSQTVPPLFFNNFNIGVNTLTTFQPNNTFQFSDGFSKAIGPHTLKFGGVPVSADQRA
jgi:hypothetical protein